MLTGVPPRPPLRQLLLRALAWASLTGGTALVWTFLILYFFFSNGLPEIPRVDRYSPPILSEVYTDDAVLAGEFYSERRKVVSYERIPKRLIQAFIASEDSNFFDHWGVDMVGSSRAVFKTILKKAGGEGSIQGGSTLTQQTAKAVLISAEGYKAATQRSGWGGIRRKIREAILAHRLEQALSKEEILYLYLNNVYLGHHSYGVQAAAENYYRKDVKDLTLAEMSLVAGLPQAPSRYSPFLNPEAAKRRRSYVLRRMLEEGMISKAEHDKANQSEVKVYPVEDVFHQFAPYFAEQVRKHVVDKLGNPLLLKGGLKIFTTMDSEKQRAAQDAVFSGLLQVDKRQGYRGPVRHLSNAKEISAFIDKSKKVMGEEKIQKDDLYVAVVTSVDNDGLAAQVQVGPHKGVLPLLGMRWARKVNPEGYYPSQMLTSISRPKTLQAGDVIVVRAVAAENLTDDKEQEDKKLASQIPSGIQLFRLEQEPELQSALVSIDPQRQYLVSMVGGYDFDANEYNRAFQACRQPGSAFKPLVYAAAIELLGWTQATILVDSPVVENDPEHQMTWKPENYTEDFKGDVLLRTALTHSMNIPAIKTFVAVGVKQMSDWSKRLGLSTPMNPDFSAALGSSCVYPNELAGVYATINRLGEKRPSHFIRKIEDRFGRMLEDHTAYDDAWAPLVDRIAAGYARLAEPSDRVMAPDTGFIVTDLLRNVVREGTGAAASRLGKPAAGKTGTTNDSFDAWFAGFTKDLVTVVWVGYDLNPHPLGRYETGGRAALPIWLQYMRQALAGRPQPEFQPPPELEMVKKRVDLKTGRLASGASRSSEEMWFKKGTEPTEAEVEKGKVDVSDFAKLPN
jgi:penicillin-binding protein 1A